MHKSTLGRTGRSLRNQWVLFVRRARESSSAAFFAQLVGQAPAQVRPRTKAVLPDARIHVEERAADGLILALLRQLRGDVKDPIY